MLYRIIATSLAVDRRSNISTIALTISARQRGRPPGALRLDQYSLGSKITPLVKYSTISDSGKSVISISFEKTILLLRDSHRMAETQRGSERRHAVFAAHLVP
jgi:hypothetical protein